MKLLEGLNRIEKKLIKESGLRKFGSHKPSDDKEKQEVCWIMFSLMPMV
jgi:hypothetical protein